MNTGQIWLIDDDQDDHEMVRDIFKELKLPNELVMLHGSVSAMEKLKEADDAPFIILCDVNLPKMDGFALREAMLENPSKKFHSVPFIFWSSVASENQITRAFNLSVHGFFIKETTFQEMKNTFIQIISYWQKSKMPSKTASSATP
jgi:CheY-like chemotaxis protein